MLTTQERRQLNSLLFVGPIGLLKPYVELLLLRAISDEELKEVLALC